MKGFCDILMQLAVSVTEAAFLYIWLKAFLKRRDLNRKVTIVVFMGLTAVSYFANSAGSVVYGMLLGLAGYFVLSIPLFQERIGRVFFYVNINYVLGTAVKILVELIRGLMQDVRSDAVAAVSFVLFTLIEKVLQFLLYYLIIKKLSTKIKTISSSSTVDLQHTWKHDILFCSVPIVTCCLMIVIRASGMRALSGTWAKVFLVIGILGSVIANMAVVYLLEASIEIMEKNKTLETENLRFSLEEKNYRNMEKLHEEYDIFLHDIKHMMRTIAALAEDGNCAEIERVIAKMRTNVGNIEQTEICCHPLLNALLSERKGYANDTGVILDMEIKEPLYFQEIDDLDIIALVGNLLDNAIEAERQSKKQEGILCHMRMAREGRHMIIQVENSYDEEKQSRKLRIKGEGQIGEKHGIGLESIRASVRKYGGIMESEKEKGRYSTKIILPVLTEWESDVSDAAREITVLN